MFLSGRNNTSPNAWFGSSQPQKHCLFCSVRANRSPGLASSLQTPSRVGSGFVSVRRLHGYWDSPEISSAFPGAQRRMFPCRCTCLFTCNMIIKRAVAGVKFLVSYYSASSNQPKIFFKKPEKPKGFFTWMSNTHIMTVGGGNFCVRRSLRKRIIPAVAGSDSPAGGKREAP